MIYKTMELNSKDCATDVETELYYLFSSIKENPSRTDNFNRIYWMCENNITDEVKIILLSTHSLNTFKYHLKNWDSEEPLKAIISNLKFVLFLAEKLPELKYKVLIKSRYFTELLRIYNNCLKYLFQRKQEEIDENCMLFLALSYVSKYAVKFCINDKTNAISSFGQQFFKQALTFLRYINVHFARNPNNCVYLLILTNTMNTMMSKFSAYRTLFVELNGIQYCLNWLSDCYKNKNKVLQTLYYDLRILSILENFVDDPFFFTNKTTITTRLIKYLKSCGALVLESTLIKESNWKEKENKQVFLFKKLIRLKGGWDGRYALSIDKMATVFQFACNIIIKMAVTIKEFKKDVDALRLKLVFLSFLNKFPNSTCVKTIYTTLLVLEDTPETQESIEEFENMNIFTIIDKCERLSNILQLSKIHNISVEDTSNFTYPEV